MPQSRACAAVSPADYQAYLTDPATPVTEGATIPDLAVCRVTTSFAAGWAYCL